MKDNILLVAGGTGGHIWPAISFGRWIEKTKPEFDVNYMCGSRALEAEIYKSAEVSPFVLDMQGSPLSGSSAAQRLGRLKSLFTSYFEAKRVLKKLKPKACVLFAGYISFPAMFACKSLNIPFLLHEQNAYAGKVTRIASRLGVKICTGWKSCKALSDGTYTFTGVPVRDFDMREADAAWKALNIEDNFPGSPVVAVMTGSLGSLSIKEKISEAAGDSKFENWTFIFPAVSDKPQKAGKNIYLLPKVWDASLLFSVADMAVVRGGGSTLTEVGTLGIPAIVIPWRAAADDHQYFNASAYARENRAIVKEENESGESFKAGLLELYRMYKNNGVNSSEGLYNRAEEICEKLWSALSVEFERSACRGTEQ